MEVMDKKLIIVNMGRHLPTIYNNMTYGTTQTLVLWQTWHLELLGKNHIEYQTQILGIHTIR